ncbi:hypothetical protein SEL4741_40870 [Salmonella enterica subsp. enterica serovar 4,[5],12:i:-]|nr:hypothetical protein SEL3835_41990 [Salmonella enterica subsp. enterica serovar 4,[5],12:i:-]BCH86692.1 hypothetical protein SEL4126_41610 [Salmonella enterica subsp. enterica serovar Typhimurium]BCH74009.1 hypothetical protein SEL3837_08160 [Salmonella enterica subsp. enterica serovar 4,[5],12:i:-]BCH82032.1 hypothetical protein SEL3844_41480 [Salmonella enterica subsp. enterica serovar 4,[5],12:i:-]BCH91282.1 hypothetical protein SEL4233_40900 [Salmonella enterica subsp. enterica serovar 4
MAVMAGSDNESEQDARPAGTQVGKLYAIWHFQEPGQLNENKHIHRCASLCVV